MKGHRPQAAAGPTLAGPAIAVAGGWAGLALIASAVALARQAESSPFQAELIGGLLDALALAALSFGFRFLRWHRLATRLAPELPLAASARIQAIGFALSATPGKLGELLKLHLLAEQTGIPAGRGGSIVLVERLTEGLTFIFLATAGGLVMSRSGDPALAAFASIGTVALIAGFLFLRRKLGHSAPRHSPTGGRGEAETRRYDDLSPVPASPRPRVPLSLRLLVGERRGEGSRWRRLLADLGDGTGQIMRPGPLVEAFLLCVAARTCDSLALGVVLASLGSPIHPGVGLFALGVSGTVGGLSMLPGGAGAAEATMSGLLLAAGLDGATALTGTLLVRGIVYWLWVGIGLGVAVRGVRNRRGVTL